MKYKKYDYLIVGAGLFGAVFAYLATQKGKKCLLIDKRSHSGGNIYCDTQADINVHKYGAHIFHTHRGDIWKFVNSLVPFNNYVNSPIAYYKERAFNLPFNMNTFNQLWGTATPQAARTKLAEEQGKYAHIDAPRNLEEQALKICGREIYNIFIKGYTEKQWGRKATELPAFIIKRVPFRFEYNNNYFNDPYQGIPIGGYNKITDALIAGCEVRLNSDYFSDREYFDNIAHKTVFTGCIDQYFDYQFGELEYRSLRFETKTLDTDNFQGNAVFNYTDFEVPYTRVIEHKHFEFGKQPSTVVSYEYPDNYERGKEPYYPINSEANMSTLKKYQDKAATMPNVLFGGRLGSYKYSDMDDSIIGAFDLWQTESKTTSL